jgi:hypothetical protein
LKSEELFVRIVGKVIDARLVTGDFLQTLQFRNISFDEGSEMLVQGVQVVRKCLFEQVVKLTLTQRLFDCDLLDFIVAVLTHLDCLPFDLNASTVYFLRSELAVKCFDGVWLGVLVGLGIGGVRVDSGNDIEAIELTVDHSAKSSDALANVDILTLNLILSPFCEQDS